ncbi:MAG TPA: chromate transporter [Bryobacteraceae bacterium]|nr:chromate transporter [Bryobacteraceae bacterium]
MSRVTLKRLTWIFLRIGNLTFGGGDPSMAALQSELVHSRGWLNAEQYALIYGLARITPGTNLLAFSAASGWMILGWAGALSAVLSMTVPPAIIVVLLTGGYEAWNSNALAMAAIGGTLAAATGMMATSAWQLLAPQIGRGRRLRTLVIFLAALVASLRFSMSPIAVLGVAALVGLVWRGPAEQ